MNNAYIRAQQLKVKEAKFPFVKIGTQYWTTKNLSLSVTPQGNTIPEVQANGNVEKITNIADREFSSDTGFWGKTNQCSISDGVGKIVSSDGTYQRIYKSGVLTIGKYYKITITLNVISGGGIDLSEMINIPSAVILTSGIKTIYGVAVGTDFTVKRNGVTNSTIDDISVQEIGWSGSQELYDGIYAQTSGTVEQKTYAAVKAAAMWSHYNNDVAIGAVYGKLYNWFAVKLFQMDIDYYNAANPTTPWGWRMPTQAEFQTLSTYLGGDAVSGGHLKEAGLAHWLSPNTGADNSSGFCAVPGGFRSYTIGEFNGIYNRCIFGKYLDINGLFLNYNANSSALSPLNNGTGISIRLIKA